MFSLQERLKIKATSLSVNKTGNLFRKYTKNLKFKQTRDILILNLTLKNQTPPVIEPLHVLSNFCSSSYNLYVTL